MKTKVCIWLSLASALMWFIFPGFSQAKTFTVNSFLDEVDANIGDCECLTASQTCTLRAAIQEANACLGDDIINLPPGTYTLTIPGRDEDLCLTGDLDITGNLSINGTNPMDTIIDGNQLDRVFHITPFPEDFQQKPYI